MKYSQCIAFRMSCEASQLLDIEPPASQVVTIETPTKKADICVSKTDHSNSLLKSISRRVSRTSFTLYKITIRKKGNLMTYQADGRDQCSERLTVYSDSVIGKDRNESTWKRL